MTPRDWKIVFIHGVTPDNLSFTGWLYMIQPSITTLPDNRSIFTAAKAIADQKRSATYVAAVEAEEARRTGEPT